MLRLCCLPLQYLSRRASTGTCATGAPVVPCTAATALQRVLLLERLSASCRMCHRRQPASTRLAAASNHMHMGNVSHSRIHNSQCPHSCRQLHAYSAWFVQEAAAAYAFKKGEPVFSAMWITLKVPGCCCLPAAPVLQALPRQLAWLRRCCCCGSALLNLALARF